MSSSDHDTSTASGRSLYDSLGGEAGVHEVVERLYARVTTDPMLSSFFADVDLPRLKRHQALVIAEVLGGPSGYDGVGLAAGHARLAITDADFDRVGTHLLAVLDELDAGSAAEDVVRAALEQVRPDIVTNGHGR